MRYAVAYVSNLSASVSNKEIDRILSQAEQYNNQNDLTGLLIFSEGNFFQLIEGERNKVEGLYSKIVKDSRHGNVIKFVEKEIHLPAYNGYYCDKVNERYEMDQHKFKIYVDHLKVLDLSSRKAVMRVLQTIFPLLCER